MARHEVPMIRVAMVSFALAMLAAGSGCERKPTSVPEATAKKADFAPPEEYELAGAVGEAVGEEEHAPGLSGS